jgi:peptidoglycan hydrolase CwlO-like protein
MSQSNWETQVINLQKTLDEIKNEVKDNRAELVELKEEMATGKGAVRAVLWIGGLLGAIWTIMKIVKIG